MATHFARGILTDGHLTSTRLPSACHHAARQLPEHQRHRFLASRALLAELMFMLYGISELPDIVIQPNGRPVFFDVQLPHFSLAYAGNMVGVAITTEGICGLDMELQRTTRGLHSPWHRSGTSSATMKSCGSVTRAIRMKPRHSSSRCVRAC